MPWSSSYQQVLDELILSTLTIRLSLDILQIVFLLFRPAIWVFVQSSSLRNRLSVNFGSLGIYSNNLKSSRFDRLLSRMFHLSIFQIRLLAVLKKYAARRTYAELNHRHVKHLWT
jgi:hypothetical protein